jgi:hypothetical protein
LQQGGKAVNSECVVEIEQSEATERTSALYKRLSAAPRELSNLSCEQLHGIVELRVADGVREAFQRAARTKSEAEVAEEARRGMIFPPIMVARLVLPNRRKKHVVGDIELRPGSLVMIDGQARRAGCIKAECGLPALIVDCELDLAKHLFIVHNKRVTRVNNKHILRVSDNPLATTMRAIAAKWQTSPVQINRLMDGIVRGASTGKLDLVGMDTVFAPNDVALAEFVMNIWTDSKMWQYSVKAPSDGYVHADIYSGVGTMHLLGLVAREQRGNPKLLKRELLLLKNANWHPNKRLGAAYGSSISSVLEMYTIATTTILRERGPKACPQDHVRPPNLRARWRNGMRVRPKGDGQDV